MSNVLVIGGTRFFGRKLVEQLIKAGENVTIMTRGRSENPFGTKVEHLIADRSNKDELAEAVEGRFFDIVYDNICYSSNEAYEFCEVFNNKTHRLIFTSTLSTYEVDGTKKVEADFNPYTYEIKMGTSKDFTYAEGKRQAEAVFYEYATFDVVAVRFPIVMGEDDYTRRLHYHVEHVASNQQMGFDDLDVEMSFIQATEAAEFLLWVGKIDFVGPINATASGKISMGELLQLIEEKTGERAIVTFDQEAKDVSPYAVPKTWYMSNEKATALGFSFTQLHDWLPHLIENIARK